jgi:hypothetical protein
MTQPSGIEEITVAELTEKLRTVPLGHPLALVLERGGIHAMFVGEFQDVNGTTLKASNSYFIGAENRCWTRAIKLDNVKVAYVLGIPDDEHVYRVKDNL